MARWIVAGLVVLNLLLGVGVYLRLGGEKTAHAQTAQLGRPVGEFATVAGQAMNKSVVYILDVNTGNLVVLNNDVINRQCTLITRHNVLDDIKRIR